MCALVVGLVETLAGFMMVGKIYRTCVADKVIIEVSNLYCVLIIGFITGNILMDDRLN